MANISTALSSILDTITNVAKASTQIVDVASKSVGALDTYVTTSLAKQDVSSSLDLVNYFETIQQEKQLELAHQQTQIDEILSKNTELKKNYDQAGQILKPTFDRIKSKYFPEA